MATVDFSSSKVVYLSDLKPIKEQWTPLIGIPEAAELIRQHGLPRRNQTFRGTQLSLLWHGTAPRGANEVRYYDQGLAMRSKSVLEYRLPRDAKQLRAVAGIDPQCVEQGHVILTIEADKSVLWEGAVSGAMPPVQLELDISGANRLRLTVDYGENLDFGDRLHLVEAGIWK